MAAESPLLLHMCGQLDLPKCWQLICYIGAIMRILLVDDEEKILHVLAETLTDAGHETTCAGDGAQALDVLHCGSFDLVITDIRMPGMDGLELLDAVSTRFRGLPVILITGQGDEDTAISAVQRGAYDYLRKPVHLRVLMAAVQRLEQQHHLEQQLQEEQARLHHASRLAAIGALAASITHEVNSPATYMKGNAQLLARMWQLVGPALDSVSPSTVGDPKQFAFARQEIPGLISGLRDGVDRIIEVVKQVGSMARQEQQQTPTRNTSLTQCADDAVRLARHTFPTDLCLSQEYGGADMGVMADPQQLTQVIINLLTNAGHAVSTAGIDSPTIALRAGRENGYVRLEIEDNGNGVPASMQPKVFEPFFTTRDQGEGTGLGLSIAQEIIKGFGGQMGFRSQEGEGACFWILLPRWTSLETP